MLAFILVCCSVLFGIFRKGKPVTGKRNEDIPLQRDISNDVEPDKNKDKDADNQTEINGQ